MNQIPLPLTSKPPSPPSEPPKASKPEPLPVKRLRRRGDPRTSVEAARRQISASPEVLRITEEILQDCISRSDYEIWEEFQRRGYKWTRDAIRHARLVLAEVGLIRELDFTRLTPDGCAARVWLYVPETAEKLKETPNTEDLDDLPARPSKPTSDQIRSALDEIQARDTPQQPMSSETRAVLDWLRKKYVHSTKQSTQEVCP